MKYWNCTFANNFCAQTGGGAVARSGAIMTMHNSILWDNTATVGTVQDQNLLKELSGTTINVQYSTVEGWTGSLGGAGNNGTNPQFVNALGNDATAGNFDDDLHLNTGSAAIDVFTEKAENGVEMIYRYFGDETPAEESEGSGTLTTEDLALPWQGAAPDDSV